METRKTKELVYSFAITNYLTNPLLVKNIEYLLEDALKQSEFEIGELKGKNMRLEDRVISLEIKLRKKAKWAKVWKRLAKLWKK